MDDLAEGGTGVRLVELGPEQAGDAIAPLEGAAWRQREIRQESEHLRLCQEGVGIGLRDAAQGDAAEQIERRPVCGNSQRVHGSAANLVPGHPAAKGEATGTVPAIVLTPQRHPQMLGSAVLAGPVDLRPIRPDP